MADLLAFRAHRGHAMMRGNDDIRVRPGRVRSRGDANSRRFVSQVLRAAEKAGGVSPRRGAPSRSSTFGRGRAASVSASRLLIPRTRIVTVKARVVRNHAGVAKLAAHVAYLLRDGVTRDGAAGRLFSAERDAADGRSFAERSSGDRHHFRFIVAPEDGAHGRHLRLHARPDDERRARPRHQARLDRGGAPQHRAPARARPGPRPGRRRC